MTKARLLGAVGIVVVVGGVLVAQAPTSPAFEAATVKQNKFGDESVGGLSEPGGRFTVKNTPLREIIRVAYIGQIFQIVGGPSWIDTDRFDIVAKAAGNPSPQEMWLMLRPLLAERFKLTVHNETRQLPVPMRTLANQLTRNVGRAVQDRTGLVGSFDYELEWTPAPGDRNPVGLPLTPSAGVSDGSSDAGPSLFTALQEQLGLKLESATGPVDVVVIDHVERPTED